MTTHALTDGSDVTDNAFDDTDDALDGWSTDNIDNTDSTYSVDGSDSASALFSPVSGEPGAHLTRRRALLAAGTLAAAVVLPIATGPVAAATQRFRLEATSTGGTTLWTAAFSLDSEFRQVENSDGARDYIRGTYHETGERLTGVTAYTRNGTDAFVFDGDRSDFRYLEVRYFTGNEPTFRLNGRRIGPFGSWKSASPDGSNSGPF